MKRHIVTAVALIIVLGVLSSGCAASGSDSQDGVQENNSAWERIEGTGEITADDADEEEKEGSFSYGDLSGLEFYFSSGAGGWFTVLRIHEDGSFDCHYQDSDMGVTGDGYPNGTLYYSDAEGIFGAPEQVNAYTYRVKIESVNYPCGDGEEIKDGVRYIYTDAYGIAGTDELYLYVPGAPVADLPEEYLSWVRFEVDPETMSELPFYGLYNEPQENGFSSFNAHQNAVEMIRSSVTYAEGRDAELQAKLQEDLSQTELNLTSGELYQAWDDALNEIWQILKSNLDTEEMAVLTEEELRWIADKEAAVQEAGAEFEGGSMQPLIMNQKAAALTRDRVYELADKLK